MISHKYKCIFIHIPKCAGTSIESKLGHLDQHDGRGGQDHRSLRMIEKPFLTLNTLCSLENMTQLLYRAKYQIFEKVDNPRNKYTVSNEQYKSYFKFSIVRNPWSRAFSWYKNVIRDDIHLKNYGITKETPFKEFLIHFAGRRMLKPQVYWLKDFNGKLGMDYIGHFENLQEDIHKIFERLKINETSLPHLLKGSSDDYRNFYDDESHNIITDIYREDIKTFGYKFE